MGEKHIYNISEVMFLWLDTEKSGKQKSLSNTNQNSIALIMRISEVCVCVFLCARAFVLVL